jgi:MFS family permease
MNYANEIKESSPSLSSKTGFFYGYVIVLASFLILMIVWGAQYSFGTFFKPMLNEFGMSRAVLSGAYSINLVMLAVASIFVGKLSDKYGSRLVVTVCGSLLGVSYLLMSQVQMVWQIYIIFGIIASIGVAGSWVPLMSTIARWFVFRRGLMIGIAAAGIGAGLMIFPPLSSYLISNLGWRTSYIIIGLILLVLVIISAQMLKNDPSQIGQSALGSSEQHEADSWDLTLQEALHTRQFWLLSAVFLCMGACIYSVMVHIVPHAMDVGISPVTAATVISVIGGVSIISKVATGSAVDRLGIKQVTLMVTSLMLISFIVIQISDSLWVLYTFAVIFAFGYGGFSVIQVPYLAELFGLKYLGAIFGVAYFLLNAGAFGPFVVGKIFDVTSSYSWAFIFLAIMSSLATLCVIGIKTSLHARHSIVKK